jgi:hypothetical protein
MSPVETEEPDQPGGQKQGVTGDKNRGRRGTTRRPTKEPDEPEEPDSSAVPAERTADDDRESVSNSTSVDAPLNPAFSTSDDAPTSAPERPVPRADARTEPVAAQQQPPSHASESIGAAANGSDDADAGRSAFTSINAAFAWLLGEYPKDHIGDEANASAIKN